MNQMPKAAAKPGMKFVEEVEVRGHIIDSLILPKILDVITAGGGAFQIKKIAIGQDRSDASYALLEVRAPKAAKCWQKFWHKLPTTARYRPL